MNHTDNRIDFLEWLTNQSQSCKGSMLPPDRILAKKFGVTARTIARWMKTATERNLVTRVRGQGSYAGERQRPDFADDKQRRGAASEIFARRLRDCISGGDIRSGRALPAVKYLCRTYEVSPLTVRRACLQLESAGLISRYGRLWRVVSPRILSGTHSGSGVLIVCNKEDLAGLFVNELLSSSYRHMEQELLTFGYCLRYTTFEEFDQLQSRLAGPALIRGLLFYKVTESSMPRVLEHALRARHGSHGRHTCPVLVDRWTGVVPPQAPVDTILNRATILKSFAQEFVRFVVMKGYARVLFFLTQGEAIWHHFYPDHIYTSIRGEMRNTVPDIDRRILVHAENETLGKQTVAQKLWGSMVEFLSDHDPFLGGMEELQHEVVIWSDFGRCIDAGQGNTLWVFPHDSDAIRALEWLKKRHIPVPKSVAVLGLEERPEYVHLGLSNIAPDWSGIGYLLAHALMGDIPVAKNDKRFMQTRAVAVDRASTNSSLLDGILG